MNSREKAVLMTRTLLPAIFLTLFSQTAWAEAVHTSLKVKKRQT